MQALVHSSCKILDLLLSFLHLYVNNFLGNYIITYMYNDIQWPTYTRAAFT